MEQRRTSQPRRLPLRRFSVPSNARRGQIEMVALPTTKQDTDINGNDTEEEIL
jgi:hypothetical protein